MSKDKPTDVTGAPVYVDPKVSPQAAAYHAGLLARAQAKKGGPAKYGVPVGGVPMPHIPRLDQLSANGTTMAAQAEMAGPTTAEVLQARPSAANSIVERPIPMGRQAPPQFLPTDMLSPEAQTDPDFQQGSGSMFAVVQPLLAQKYGIIRNGKLVPPGQLAPQPTPHGTSLRPETMAGLKALDEMRSRQDMPAVAPAEETGEKEKGMTPEEKKEVDEAIKQMDSFDYDSLRKMINRDILNNPEQKDIITARLKPLDIDELIMKNRVSQDVTVIPGHFSVRFSSMTGAEDLSLKQLIMEESKSTEVTDRYLLDKFAFMSLTLGTTHINGQPTPSCNDDKGEFNRERFWLKFKWMTSRSLHMLASIGINHSWFEQRVRGMFVAKKLGNG